MAFTPRQIAIHVGLFVATFFTTTVFGGQMVGGGLEFSVPLMLILLTHEMGHFVVARRRGVPVSLPYFIPIPAGFGTLGAVIRMPAAVRSRDALVAIGAAGPLAGLAVAIPVLWYGLSTSEVHAMVPNANSLQEGNSLLYLALKFGVHGEWLPGHGRDVFLSPVAMAGWVGLLVTFINLIPIGQLDGGHIAYGYFGEGHNRASEWFSRALVPVGIAVLLYVAHDASSAGSEHPWGQGFQASLSWFIWPVMLRLMRRMSNGVWHPPTGDEPLSPGYQWLCRLMLLVFVLIFMPIPMRVGAG